MSASEPNPADALLVLLKAASPDTIQSILVDVFRLQNEKLTEGKSKQWSESLSGASVEEVASVGSILKGLFEALLPLVRESVYLNLERAADVQELFPPGFHADLGKLLGRLVSKLVPGWRQSALVNQVSPPKLVDVDWRVDLQTSSNLLARMSVPSVLVEMKIQEVPQDQGVVPDIQTVQFELSKPALGTMLHGLEKINEQLGSIQQ